MEFSAGLANVNVNLFFFIISMVVQKIYNELLHRHRSRPNEIASMDLVGAVADTDAIIIDDIVDTAGTLCEAARQLKMAGAKRVFAFVTHGIFLKK